MEPTPLEGNVTSTTSSSSSPRGTIKDALQIVTNVVTAATVLITLVAGQIDQARAKIPILGRVDQTHLLALGLTCLSLWVLIQWKKLRKEPILLKPEALVFGDQPVSRRGEVTRLMRVLGNNSVVFLFGESGAGKSTLLEFGLAPELRRDPTRMPLYIRDWGDDWVKGAEQAVADSINRELKLLPESPFRFPVTGSNYMTALRELRDLTGKKAVLLFDQFDDYQNAHPLRFVDSEGTILSAEMLIKQNRFWAEICELQISQVVVCLFAVRSDLSFVLESVRFRVPASLELLRLPKGSVLPLLRARGSGDVIANREFGWALCANMSET